MTATYQVMPDLTPDEYAELKSDIASRGVMVPVEFDEAGNVLDGHHRLKICEELGITEYPKVIRAGMTEQEKRTHARKLNMARRQLTQEQRRGLMQAQLIETPQKSDRQIARDLGVSPTTVGSVRHEMEESGQVSRLDTSTGADGKTYPRERKPAPPPEPIKEATPQAPKPLPVVEYAEPEPVKESTAHVDEPETPATVGPVEMELEGESEPPEIVLLIEPEKEPAPVPETVERKPHIAYNSGNNEWYTPAEYIEAARAVMGSIDLDPASSEIANQTVKASAYYTAETNGLDKKWSGNVWLNPPYASDLIGRFIDKLTAERGTYNQAVVLVNNATETEWFFKLVSVASAVVFPKGRVKFYKPDGETGAPLQGQAVVYIGDAPGNFLNKFRRFGWGGPCFGGLL